MSSLRILFLFCITLALALVLSVSQSKQSQTKPAKPTQDPAKPPTSGQEIDAGDVIRINTTLVSSPVLVIGRDGKFIPNLKREDFQVFENGEPQEIADFSPVEKPFTVALLIDTSRSTVLDLQDIQDAAISFVEKMRPNDRALVVRSRIK